MGKIVRALVVGCVLLGLASLALISFTSIPSVPRGSRDQALIKMLEEGCNVFRKEYGVFPPQEPDLGTRNLVRAMTALRITTLPDGTRVHDRPPIIAFRPGQLHTLPSGFQVVDSWGNPLRYRNPGLKNPKGVDVESPGKNGHWGDGDDLWNRAEEH